MITYEKVLILKNVPLFEQASELALADLISVAQEKTLKEGDVLLKEDQKNDSLYLVLSGCLKTEVKKEDASQIGARQLFGETTVFNPAVLGVKVVAQEKTTLLKWSSTQLYTIMSLHPTLAMAFLGTLSHRLRLYEKKKIES